MLFITCIFFLWREYKLIWIFALVKLSRCLMIRANKDMVNLSITVIILYWTEYIDIEFRNIKTVMVNLSSLNKWSLSQWWLLAFVSRFVCFLKKKKVKTYLLEANNLGLTWCYSCSFYTSCVHIGVRDSLEIVTIFKWIQPYLGDS